MRYLCMLALLLVGMAHPSWAQDSPPDHAQFEQIRDILQRYGTRMLALSQQRQLLNRLREVATPEQEQAIRRIHITPQQGGELLALLRDTLPEAILNHDSPADLQRRLGPEVVNILGPAQADLILELQPSPQQMERVQDILRSAGESWQGLRLDPAMLREISSSLSPEQRQWLEMFLDVVR